MKRTLAICCSLLLLAGCTGATNPEPSPTARETFKGTPTEYEEALAKCIRDKGYSAQVVEGKDGTPELKYEAPGLSDNEAFKMAQKCEDQLPAQPEPVTEADFRVLYDHMVEQTKCIQAKGHKTPPIPSWQSFLEMAKRSDITWIPNEYLEDSESNEVMKACTPDPDLWW